MNQFRAVRPSPLLEAALAYAARGWLVFPIHSPVGGTAPCSCGDADCSSPGKHPRTQNGFKDASIDPTVIEGWWTNWPDANIGIVTGVGSGLAVLDIDPRHGGDDTLAELVEQHGGLPETIEVATGGGGVHLYFACPAVGQRSKNAFRPGLDLKADGGYVVAPPSLHESGEYYAWAVHPDEVEVAAAPAWLLELVNARRPSAPSTAAKPVENVILDGGRNTHLCRIAGGLRRKGVDPSAIEAALLAENQARCQPPLGEVEVLKVARGIQRYEPESSIGEVLPLTDSGNARRLVRRFGGDLRFCHPWRKPLVWDGRRWRVDDTGAALGMTHAIVREIAEEADLETDQGYADALRGWAKKSGMVERRKAMIPLSASEPGIPVLPTELDQHPLLLNTANGTLDLETIRLREPNRGDLLTKSITIGYEPGAVCPRFDAFLARVVPDEEIRAFLQRVLGYCLSGLVVEHVLLFLYGRGSNGKSTLLRVLQALLGRDYAAEAAPDLLLAKDWSAHPTELAELFGKRLVVCQESGEGRALDEPRVKRLTGGDLITARRMREDFWTFEPTHKLWLSSNYRPKIRGMDEGIWRRVLLVPFAQEIPEPERDRELPAKLMEELPGVLAWGVRGWEEYRRGGLQPPEAVRVATAQYRLEEDAIGRFIVACTEPDPAGRVQAAQLFEAYQSWCKENSERTVSQTALGVDLVKRGFEKVKSGTIGYLGLRLRGSK